MKITLDAYKNFCARISIFFLIFSPADGTLVATDPLEIPISAQSDSTLKSDHCYLDWVLKVPNTGELKESLRRPMRSSVLTRLMWDPVRSELHDCHMKDIT
jgi:hypothetical protein